MTKSSQHELQDESYRYDGHSQVAHATALHVQTMLSRAFEASVQRLSAWSSAKGLPGQVLEGCIDFKGAPELIDPSKVCSVPEADCH